MSDRTTSARLSRMTDAEFCERFRARLQARLASGFDALHLLSTAARALEVAAAQLDEEWCPTEFTLTSRKAAQRTVEAALAKLLYGNGPVAS